MSTLAGDFWVCGDCRSINNAGARQCYNCRTPRDRAAVDPTTIDPARPGKLRRVELPGFESSRWAAVLATILIIAVAILQVVQYNLVTALISQTLAGVASTDEQIQYVGSVGIVAFGIALLALIAWSLWLSRTVTSMPALGLGYPPTNGMMAFVENFVPILNLFRVPAIVRDVVRRLEPTAGRGEALIFAAWIGLLGGFLVPRVLVWFARDPENFATIAGIGTGLVLIGAIFMVVLIWWVERHVRARRDIQLAELRDETAPEPAGAAAPPPADVVQTRSAFDAASSAHAADPSATAGAALPATAAAFTLPLVTEPEPPVAADPPAVAEPVAEPEIPAMVAATPDVVAEAPAVVADAPAVVADAPAAEPLVAVAADTGTEPAPEAESPSEPPHLTVRITSRGLITAEMEGEIEHILLDDLGPYASALAEAGGHATIVLPSDDPMPGLIGRRAQRILEDAGVQVTTA
jgi:cytoskeletal protein RodZ